VFLIATTSLVIGTVLLTRSDEVVLTEEQTDVANVVVDNKSEVEAEIEKIADPVKRQELQDTLNALIDARINASNQASGTATISGGTTSPMDPLDTVIDVDVSGPIGPETNVSTGPVLSRTTGVDIRTDLDSNLGISGPSIIPRKDYNNLGELWGYLQKNDIWMTRRGSQENFF